MVVSVLTITFYENRLFLCFAVCIPKNISIAHKSYHVNFVEINFMIALFIFIKLRMNHLCKHCFMLPNCKLLMQYVCVGEFMLCRYFPDRRKG